MPTHDIIDNRDQKLADHIRLTLEGSKAAHFAVGYFFISGLQGGIAERLARLDEIRLLIGNTTNAQTLDQLAEGRRRLELVADIVERQQSRRRAEAREMAAATADNVRDALGLMDQTDEAEAAVRLLLNMMEHGKLQVRVYTRGRMHAKAYIFDYGPVYDLAGEPEHRAEKGSGVVGSSNLTLHGLTHNTELNVVVHGNDNHAALKSWFEELWELSEPFDETLMGELRQSWAAAKVTPWEIYMKILYTLVRDRLEGGETTNLLNRSRIEEQLADFQKVAVDVACRMIEMRGGCFVSDVVGLGKSFIGSAIVKRFEQTGSKPLVICPAGLVEMWRAYNEEYELNAEILSMGMLSDEARAAELLDPINGFYKRRDFVLIDESHNFRSNTSNRYAAMETFLEQGERPVCLLTATPRNKSAWDIYHQLKLFHPDDKTTLDIDPPALREFFRKVEGGEKRLEDLLGHVLYRRRRQDILQQFGFDAQTHEPLAGRDFEPYRRRVRRAYVMVGGRRQYFPHRKLQTVEYSIEDAYNGLYQQLRKYLGHDRRSRDGAPTEGELTYARYGIWHYVHPALQGEEPYKSIYRAGANLRGLVRVMLFKRLESSVQAFRRTVSRMLATHERFLEALEEGVVAAGREAQQLLHEASDDVEMAELLQPLREVAGTYDIADFDVQRLERDLWHDVRMLREIVKVVEPITPDRDAKLCRLQQLMADSPLASGKKLIFTEFRDTAHYLYENLSAGDSGPIDVVVGGDKNAARVVGTFAPKANPVLASRYAGVAELEIVVATDVFSEGLNLQDCDKIVNYDLHWNPVRLIQRFGRIDRIGSEHDEIYGFNFLPETKLDQHLDLRATLQRRIQEIHETIGEDAKILDDTEQLNERAMYSIYAGSDDSAVDEEDDTDRPLFVDLNQAETLLRSLQASDPEAYRRITELRDGVKSSRASTREGFLVLCEAAPSGGGKRALRQLSHVDPNGRTISRDLTRVLPLAACENGEPRLESPRSHNHVVNAVRRAFADEVRHREAERRHTVRLSRGQEYVLRELRQVFAAQAPDDLREQVVQFERIVRLRLPASVRRELNRLRMDNVLGDLLIQSLKRLVQEFRLTSLLDSDEGARDVLVTRVVCSESFLME